MICQYEIRGCKICNPLFLFVFRNFVLPLGELEALAGFGAAVFFAFYDAGITGQETALFEDWPETWLKIGQSAGNPMPHSTSLARKTTAGNSANHIKLVTPLSCIEWLQTDPFQFLVQ